MAEEPVVQEEGAEVAAPKSKKKLIIIVVAVLVLLIGGGVGAWLMMGDKPAEGEEAKEVVEKKDPVYVKLDTFTVNLSPEEGEKYLVIEDKMPQVRNRVLMLLTSKLPSEISDMEGKQELIEEIVEQINEPYSAEGEPLAVSDAFFTAFVIQ